MRGAGRGRGSPRERLADARSTFSAMPGSLRTSSPAGQDRPRCRGSRAGGRGRRRPPASRHWRGPTPGRRSRRAGPRSAPRSRPAGGGRSRSVARYQGSTVVVRGLRARPGRTAVGSSSGESRRRSRSATACISADRDAAADRRVGARPRVADGRARRWRPARRRRRTCGGGPRSWPSPRLIVDRLAVEPVRDERVARHRRRPDVLVLAAPAARRRLALAMTPTPPGAVVGGRVEHRDRVVVLERAGRTQAACCRRSSGSGGRSRRSRRPRSPRSATAAADAASHEVSGERRPVASITRSAPISSPPSVTTPTTWGTPAVASAPVRRPVTATPRRTVTPGRGGGHARRPPTRPPAGGR